VFAEGELRAYDVKEGRLLWKKATDGVGVPLIQPDSTAVLTLITNVSSAPQEGRARGQQSTEVQCLDLRNGNTLAEFSSLPGHARWAEIEFDPARRTLRVSTDRVAIDLADVEHSGDDGPSGESSAN
jgi:hypothetical protein